MSATSSGVKYVSFFFSAILAAIASEKIVSANSFKSESVTTICTFASLSINDAMFIF